MELWLNRLAQYYYIMFPTRKSQEFIGFLRTKTLFEMHSLKNILLPTQKPMAFLITDSPALRPKLIPPFFFFLAPGSWRMLYQKVTMQRSLEQKLIPPRDRSQRPSKEGIRWSILYLIYFSSTERLWVLMKGYYIPFCLIQVHWYSTEAKRPLFKRRRECGPKVQDHKKWVFGFVNSAHNSRSGDCEYKYRLK